jgi:hypothetical protein
VAENLHSVHPCCFVFFFLLKSVGCNSARCDGLNLQGIAERRGWNGVVVVWIATGIAAKGIG